MTLPENVRLFFNFSRIGPIPAASRPLGKAKLPPAIKRQPNWREVREGAMDELAYFQEMDAAALVRVALFMMLWAVGIIAIDHWVGARRSDSPRRGTGRPTDR
jgi:hypothetical protein